MKAIVNQKEFALQQEGDVLVVNGTEVQWDLADLGSGRFHVLHEGKSFQAEIVKKDPATKTVIINVNNRKYTVQLKDKFDLLLEKMGIASAGTGKMNQVKAPMPGLIVNLKVAEGDTVTAGDQLLILEAMKMENVLKSPGAGVVKKIKVKKGDSVEKNQVLIEF